MAEYRPAQRFYRFTGCPKARLGTVLGMVTGLEGRGDLTRFKALDWGIRIWDLWNFNECDGRFGNELP